MNKIKFRFVIFQNLLLLIFIGIQPSYSNTSIDDGLKYVTTTLESRFQYLSSLKNFVNDPEIQMVDKINLIGSVMSEEYEEVIKQLINLLPEESRDQEFQKIADNFNLILMASPMYYYDILVKMFRLGLGCVTSFPEINEPINQLQTKLKDYCKIHPELNWEEINQRAKLIAGYRFLHIPLGHIQMEKIFRNLESKGLADFDSRIRFVSTEFYRTELQVLEDLKRYVITLMPEKDCKFVELFKFSCKKVDGFIYRNVRVLDDDAFFKTINNYFKSINHLTVEIKRLNLEFFRIYKKINKKLCVKAIANSLTSTPEINHLVVPPEHEKTEILNYFLDSTAPHLLSKLKYLQLNIRLPVASEQELVDLLQSTSENKILVQRALDDDKELSNMTENFFDIIHTWSDTKKKELSKMESPTITRTYPIKIKCAGEQNFIESYTTNAQHFLYYEATQFNLKLSRNISSFTELLKSFDEHGIRGSKQLFKPIKRVSPLPDSQIKTELSTLSLEPDTKLPSQSLTLEDKIEQAELRREANIVTENIAEGLLELESLQKLQLLELESKGTEELEEKETHSATASLPPMKSFDESNYKIYSSYLREDEKLVYREKLNRGLTKANLTLLESLYSDSPGEIRFADLKTLVRRCGGVLQFSRGSHFRITMPGGKIAFGFKPHGSGHSSKLRNLALESFRMAFSDIREAVLVR